ncbi:MAG TPA: glycogen debranching N-terminal domain-containing protein [Candidatus Limnocylindria bacterium]
MAHRIQLRARHEHHFTYSGRSVLVTDLAGHVTGADPFGLYVDNTRVLSRLEITTDGTPPRPISASPVGGDAYLSYEELPESGGVAKEAVYLETAHFVGEGMRSVLRLRSFASQPSRFELTLRLAADFADSDEAERGTRDQDAEVEVAWDAATAELRFRYCHPQLSLGSIVSVVRAPSAARWTGEALSFPVELAAGGSAELELAIEPILDGVRLTCTPRTSFAVAAAPAERLRRELEGDMPRLVSSNPSVTRAWETATRDLASLPYGLADGPAMPIAGLPLYLQFFGRDALTIGWQAVMATPRLLLDALRANAAWRGRNIDDWLDEEPGKMIHQARNGPLSKLGHNPFIRYYGDWATPPDFLIMLGQYLAWTGDRQAIRDLLPAARDAADWCERYGDPDRDGFLEYDTRSSGGVKNQGWKDSDDAIVDERGNRVANPIASSELQAYWYAGLQQAALAFAAVGDVGYAARLIGKARTLKRRFNEAFWVEDLGIYAMGLDAEKRQIRSIGSNDGHLLASGIVPPDRGRRLAARLMQPDMFSGWGIRTLSRDHPAFNPFSYHRGTVWPVEQATIGFGFARYGCWDELDRLTRATFDLAALFVEHRLPEAVGGIQRDDAHPHPGIYARSCEPQGWSASAVVMLVQALLGMAAVAPMHLLVVDPHLPPWLPDLRLEGVRVGDARLDLEFRRTRSGRTTYRALGRTGRVVVLRQPPPQAKGAGPLGRAWKALGSLPRL